MSRRPKTSINDRWPVYFIAFSTSLALQGIAAAKPPMERVWVVAKPVQCLGNPWEKYWLRAHHQKAALYPRRKEQSIIKDYFGRLDIHILEIRTKPYENGQPLCETCNCPRGDTLFFLISATDALKMAQAGYTERFPDETTKKKHWF